MMTGALNLLEEQKERKWGQAKDSNITEEQWDALVKESIILDEAENQTENQAEDQAKENNGEVAE